MGGHELSDLVRSRLVQAPWRLETRRYLEAATGAIKSDFSVE
jgi:hypothetical protein